MTIYYLPKILVLEGCHIEPHVPRAVNIAYPEILQNGDEGFVKERRLDRGVSTAPISTDYLPSSISPMNRKTPWGYHSIFGNLNLEKL